jgi:hypothetical protein
MPFAAETTPAQKDGTVRAISILPFPPTNDTISW